MLPSKSHSSEMPARVWHVVYPSPRTTFFVGEGKMRKKEKEAYACNRFSRTLRCADRTGKRCRTAGANRCPRSDHSCRHLWVGFMALPRAGTLSTRGAVGP